MKAYGWPRRNRTLFLLWLATLSTAVALAQGNAQPPRVPDEYIDRVRRLEGDTLRVCVNAESVLAPFERDLAQEIASSLLLKLTITEVVGARARPVLDYRLSFNDRELYILMTNTCQALMGFLLSTSRFADWLTPSRPYAEHGFVLATTLPFGRLTELPALTTVGTRMASTADLALTQLISTMPTDQRWRRIPYVNNQILIDRLTGGEVDAILIWEPALAVALGQDLSAHGLHELDPSPLALPTQRFGLVVTAENGFLRVALDAAIETLVANGTVEALLAKHGIPGRAARTN